MLVYHPIYDVNHCLYRMVLVLETSIHKTFEWDTFKLMNFYLLFPHLLNEIKPFPSQLRTYKKELKTIPPSYVEVPNAKRALFDLSSLQIMAANHLAAKKLINLDFQVKNTVESSEYTLDERLSQKISSDPIRENSWFKLITDELPLLDIRGKSGLKKRTGLMEHQYDAVEENI